MKSIENKKYKKLGISFLIFIIFAAHILVIVDFSFSKSFIKAEYPIFELVDIYLFMATFINPILISSLVKKVIEIEEKNNMWQFYLILGEKVNKILIDKFKNISIKLVLLQTLESLAILFLSSRSKLFVIDSETLLRFFLIMLTVLMINLFFLGFFIIVEMKTNKAYFLSFFSIIGGLTGVISMLTSKILCLINPFGWLASLITISFVKENDHFVQIINPVNTYTIIIAFVFLLISLGYIKNMKSLKLYKD